ncbi:MAG: hypothetical protein HC801_13690 [Nitrospira sp.]|nr:hypothetical protein [Nitrospira sp.]
MPREDVIAELALRELKKKEDLRTIVHQSGLQYYTRFNIFGMLSTLASIVLVAWLFLREDVPTWGVMICVVAAIGALESVRQRDRFNALLELNDIQQRQQANKAEMATPNQPPD